MNGRCWFVSPSSLQKAMAAACRRLGLDRRITPQTLRHSFVDALLDDYDPCTVQEVCGYADVTPLVRRQEQRRLLRGVKSPIDSLKYAEKEGY